MLAIGRFAEAEARFVRDVSGFGLQADLAPFGQVWECSGAILHPAVSELTVLRTALALGPCGTKAHQDRLRVRGGALRGRSGLCSLDAVWSTALVGRQLEMAVPSPLSHDHARGLRNRSIKPRSDSPSMTDHHQASATSKPLPPSPEPGWA